MQCKNLPGKNVHVIRLNRRVSVIRHRLVLATARALPISRHKRTTYFCRPMFNTVVGYTHTSLFSVFEYPESEENKVSVSGLRSRPARVSTQRAVLWDCQSQDGVCAYCCCTKEKVRRGKTWCIGKSQWFASPLLLFVVNRTLSSVLVTVLSVSVALCVRVHRRVGRTTVIKICKHWYRL